MGQISFGGRALARAGLQPRLLVLLALFVSPVQAQPSLDARRQALSSLLAEQWEYSLRTNPISATVYGDKRWNDQLGDFSEQAVLKDMEESRKFLARFEAIYTTGFPDQEALNKELMVRDLRIQQEGARFKAWEMPVSQMDGIHILLPELITFTTFDSAKDFRSVARAPAVSGSKLTTTFFEYRPSNFA